MESYNNTNTHASKFNFFKWMELQTLYNDPDINAKKVFDALQTHFPYMNEMSGDDKKTFVVGFLEQLSTWDKSEKWKRLKQNVEDYHY